MALWLVQGNVSCLVVLVCIRKASGLSLCGSYFCRAGHGSFPTAGEF